jgi:hypothetical protein
VTRLAYHSRTAYGARGVGSAATLRRRLVPYSGYVLWAWCLGTERTIRIAPLEQVR